MISPSQSESGPPKSGGSRTKEGSPNYHYVYILRSIPHPNQIYTGTTDDLRSRVKAHNWGQSPHTSAHRPWKLVTYLSFDDLQRGRDQAAFLVEDYRMVTDDFIDRSRFREVFIHIPLATVVSR